MGEGDFGWFSPEDFNLLVAVLHGRAEPSSIVPVGGQSITAWAMHYAMDIPETRTPYLTQDSDFVATREEARHLAEALGGQLRLAEMDDHTINVGTVVFRSPTSGRKLLIDVLSCVYGLDDQAFPSGSGGGPAAAPESHRPDCRILPQRRTLP